VGDTQTQARINLADSTVANDQQIFAVPVALKEPGPEMIAAFPEAGFVDSVDVNFIKERRETQGVDLRLAGIFCSPRSTDKADVPDCEVFRSELITSG
jgi:hypothetical protein